LARVDASGRKTVARQKAPSAKPNATRSTSITTVRGLDSNSRIPSPWSAPRRARSRGPGRLPAEQYQAVPGSQRTRDQDDHDDRADQTRRARLLQPETGLCAPWRNPPLGRGDGLSASNSPAIRGSTLLTRSRSVLAIHCAAVANEEPVAVKRQKSSSRCVAADYSCTHAATARRCQGGSARRYCPARIIFADRTKGACCRFTAGN